MNMNKASINGNNYDDDDDDDEADLLDLKSGKAPTAGEKLAVLWTIARSGARTAAHMRWVDLRHVWLGGGWSVASVVDDAAAAKPDGVALIDSATGRTYTFSEVVRNANRVARWAHDVLGLRRGDRASLFMENSPEFFFAWLGFAKIGVVTAFTNFKLHGRQLQHVLKIAEARVHLVSPSLVAKFHGIVRPSNSSGSSNTDSAPSLPGLVADRDVYVFGFCSLDQPSDINYARVEDALLEISDEATPSIWVRGLSLGDTLWLIYTSGTTGMPKASTVTQGNVLARINVLSNLVGMTEDDRLYCSLPLYHSTGSLLCVASWRKHGGVIVARQFSPGRFWSECQQFGATGIVYVGEVCRYLLQNYNSLSASNNGSVASEHCNAAKGVRFAVGNGMRPDVWPKFQKAFSVEHIVEFYGSTEGSGLVNVSGRVGAVGYYPFPINRIIQKNNVLARYDVERDELVRGPDGFAMLCEIDEPGELLSRIPDEGAAGQVATSGGGFSGYTDKAATEKKILRSVFEKNDAWFRSGDLLRQDQYGFIFFVDRIGDTFRWKGENVSTAEVAEVIGTFPRVRECCVYGVEAPPREGRAGMAAISLGEQSENGEQLDRSSALAEAVAHFDWRGLHKHCASNLAGFARPVFLRVVAEVPKTATFKFKKNDLQKDGFDLSKCLESFLLIRDDEQKSFVPLTTDILSEISSGQRKL